MAEDAYGNPELPVTATTVDTDWGEAVTERVVATYPSTAVRDTEETSPVTGRLCYVTADATLYLYDGASWVAMASAGSPPVQFELWDTTPDPLSSSLAIEASTTIDLPAGWTEADVLAIGVVQYAKLPDTAQVAGYLKIDGTSGISNQSGNATTEHPVANITVATEVAGVTSDPFAVEFWARMDNATPDGTDVGKYVTVIVVMVRKA